MALCIMSSTPFQFEALSRSVLAAAFQFFKNIYEKVAIDQVPKFWHPKSFRWEVIGQNKLKKPKKNLEQIVRFH